MLRIRFADANVISKELLSTLEILDKCFEKAGFKRHDEHSGSSFEVTFSKGWKTYEIKGLSAQGFPFATFLSFFGSGDKKHPLVWVDPSDSGNEYKQKEALKKMVMMVRDLGMLSM